MIDLDEHELDFAHRFTMALEGPIPGFYNNRTRKGLTKEDVTIGIGHSVRSEAEAIALREYFVDKINNQASDSQIREAFQIALDFDNTGKPKPRRSLRHYLDQSPVMMTVESVKKLLKSDFNSKIKNSSSGTTNWALIPCQGRIAIASYRFGLPAVSRSPSMNMALEYEDYIEAAKQVFVKDWTDKNKPHRRLILNAGFIFDQWTHGNAGYLDAIPLAPSDPYLQQLFDSVTVGTRSPAIYMPSAVHPDVVKIEGLLGPPKTWPPRRVYLGPTSKKIFWPRDSATDFTADKLK